MITLLIVLIIYLVIYALVACLVFAIGVIIKFMIAYLIVIVVGVLVISTIIALIIKAIGPKIHEYRTKRKKRLQEEYEKTLIDEGDYSIPLEKTLDDILKQANRG